jgi:hypothetical protein
VFLVREPGSGTRTSMEIFLKERRIHPAMGASDAAEAAIPICAARCWRRAFGCATRRGCSIPTDLI